MEGEKKKGTLLIEGRGGGPLGEGRDPRCIPEKKTVRTLILAKEPLRTRRETVKGWLFFANREWEIKDGRGKVDTCARRFDLARKTSSERGGR